MFVECTVYWTLRRLVSSTLDIGVEMSCQLLLVAYRTGSGGTTLNRANTDVLFSRD